MMIWCAYAAIGMFFGYQALLTAQSIHKEEDGEELDEGDCIVIAFTTILWPLVLALLIRNCVRDYKQGGL
jgi:hypothetical protein